MGVAVNLLTADGFGLGCNILQRQDDMDLHWHDNIELTVVTGGTGQHCTDQGSWPIERGDAFVIPPGMEHGYTQTQDLALVNIGYQPDRLALSLAQLQRLPGFQVFVNLEPRLRHRQGFAAKVRLPDAQVDRVSGVVAHMAQELAARALGFAPVCTGYLIEILVICCRGYSVASGPAAASLLVLARLLEWIDGHLPEPMDVASLARRARCSRATLQRRFADCFDCSPMAYVTELRLQRARACLEGGGVSIAEVGRRCGFTDAAYFSRRFAARFGCAPRDWS
ncbi:MAG: AraC family transcriptional regulator [Planctomycetota bacterium]|jgi:AraC family L-rhamnose operon transcriptional activator RhaR|nr:AraC family transcriptional regulator [Planctomycetota bacterium]